MTWMLIPTVLLALAALAPALAGQLVEREKLPEALNFTRPHFTEKAYPENELIVTFHGHEQAILFERRLAPRFQLEAAIGSVVDSLDQPFSGASFGVKYVAWHRGSSAIASVGLEVTPPWGRAERWEVEPFVAFGLAPGGGLVVQGGLLAPWEDGVGVEEWGYRLVVARPFGRAGPMMEVVGTVDAAGTHAVSLVPQSLFRLSKSGHVSASLGAEIPAAGPGPRAVRLAAFLLWDYGDGSPFRGW